ncbi:DUF3500 domain-containing protein [Planomicrobium sp. CPCC 101110]|uniref:DUF3500 domain-containing protein n=1 Tax=Planomicrobium sp. CPCC 101110 TaxID=2599619 RepID=UPI0011B79BA3|nr:DUF3500 domain-containing protein [Planomicrobium sp. CPCC 101110]TWT27282.1 DUF3500 domain-containing protein [Planomicrobium sp. CPCC 101110]
MKKNMLLGFVLATSIATVLTGCGSEEESGTTSEQAESAETQSTESDAEMPEGGPPSGQGGGMGSATVDTESIVTDVAATLDEEVSVSADGASVDGQATELAQAFLATLSDEQAEAIQYDLTAENAAVWSNFPVNMVQRNGILLGSLSEESLKAAKALFYVALGEEGYQQLVMNLEAEEELGESDSGYDADIYYVSLLGEVSDSSTWILQVGGHHYANNFTFNAEQTGATPFFVGTEPQTFETADGETVEPMAVHKSAIYTMLDSLSEEQVAEAEITDKFDDVLVGPGNDGNFPAESEGILVSSLSSEQQELVKEAIEAWVSDVNEEDQEAILEAYYAEDAWAETYIAWSGSTSSEDQGSYVRIDGPRVWIEFAVQGGIIIRDEVHFHTIWRDKLADYGGEFSSQ